MYRNLSKKDGGIRVIIDIIQEYGLIIICLLMLSNGLFSAPPSEAILVLSGVWISQGNSSLLTVIAVATLGNLIGAYILYFLGLIFGDSISKVLNKLFPKLRIIDSLHYILKERPYLTLGVFRCLPMVRSIISIPAGISKLNIVKFSIVSGTGMLVWSTFWISLGNFAYNIYESYSFYISGLLLTILGITIIFLYINLKRVAFSKIKN